MTDKDKNADNARLRANVILFMCVVPGVVAMLMISPLALFIGIATVAAGASLRPLQGRAYEEDDDDLPPLPMLEKHPLYDPAEFWKWN